MADKRISDLTAASAIQNADLFVLEQNSTAKKLTGQILLNWLTAAADGHGGIASITKTGTGGGQSGLEDTYTITYADTTTATFVVTNGAKGDTGDASYLWIKYANSATPADADMSDYPDDYIGLCVNTTTPAPTTASSYTWYQWKGETGNPASLLSTDVKYQSGPTGTVVPSGDWSSNVPIVSQGNWLWTKTTLTFNSGSPVEIYTASRQGIDGTGAAGSATPLVDINGGAVGTSAAFAREDHQHPVPVLHITETISTLPTTISNANILSTMRVINCVFGTPANVTSDVAWATSDGELALSGTMTASTTTTVDIDLAIF